MGEISGKTNVSHVLGYNEPDQPDQSNMTVAQVLAGWPEIYKTGLRVGSPAYANPWNGLFEFVDSCDARNYRLILSPSTAIGEVNRRRTGIMI